MYHWRRLRRPQMRKLDERLLNGSLTGCCQKLFYDDLIVPTFIRLFSLKDRPRKQIPNFAAARKAQSGVVFCGTSSKTESLSRALRQAGHSAPHYHGGMGADLRRKVEMRFALEDVLIVVATVAFGMGMDKPDIRWITHADLPKSIDSHYQEIGRVGRDEALAEAFTLYGSDDIR